MHLVSFVTIVLIARLCALLFLRLVTFVARVHDYLLYRNNLCRKLIGRS